MQQENAYRLGLGAIQLNDFSKKGRDLQTFKKANVSECIAMVYI